MDPDAGHQMSRRSARSATTWRAASSGSSRTTRVGGARLGGARVHDLRGRAGRPDGRRVDPEIRQREGRDLLVARGHDPLERRVARLAEGLGAADEGRHRRLEHVVPRRRDAVDPDLAGGGVRLDRRGIGQVRQPGQHRDARRDDPGTAVRRVDAREHEIEFEGLERGGEDPGRGDRARAADRRVGHEHAARRAHGQRLAHRLGRGGRRHREQDHLALAGRLDELERLLEDVLVIAVDDRGAVRPVQAPVGAQPFTTRRRVGDGFGEDDDSHEPWTSRPVSRPCRAVPVR